MGQLLEPVALGCGDDALESFTDEGGDVLGMAEAGADGQGHELPGRRGLPFLRAGSTQDERHTVVPFMALEVVDGTGVSRERERCRPGAGERLRVVDGVLVVQRPGSSPPEPLDEAQIRTGALD